MVALTQATARQHALAAQRGNTRSLEILLSELIGGDIALDNLTVTTLTATTGTITTLTSTAQTTDGITGGDASLSITGLTSATTVDGGAVAIAGAASIAGATGAGGPVTVTGGACGATNDEGGPVVVTGGAGAGTGVGAQVHLRSAANTPVLVKKAVASTGTDTVTLTVAQLFNGIMVQTPSAATTLTTPTGTEISAALGASLAVGDSFDFSVINLGGAGDIITFTAGASGVTVTGQATIDDAGSDITSSGTFKFVNTAADTWIAYRTG